jgi:hypothetical protein
VVTADRHRHTLCWHPMRMRAERPGRDGMLSVIPWWGARAAARRGPARPDAELLAVWRRPRVWSELDQLTTYTALERAGYAATPPDPNRVGYGYSATHGLRRLGFGQSTLRRPAQSLLFRTLNLDVRTAQYKIVGSGQNLTRGG